MSEKVFTFWEPKESVPGYIQLCLETWRNCLPGCEVVILDYGTLGDYLTPAEQAAVLCRRMTLAMQSDCIRCAVLKKHGGIWLDADTVLTKPLDRRFSAADVTMIARQVNGGLVNYGAFIRAAKPEAKFLVDWYERLVPRVARAARGRDSFLFGLFHHHERRLMHRWDYCVNAIIDPLAATAGLPDYAFVDKDAVGALPEEDLIDEAKGIGPCEAYNRFWFGPGSPDEVLARTAGILMLHNSFTPERFRRMTAEEFLRTDTRLANLLRTVLGRRS